MNQKRIRALILIGSVLLVTLAVCIKTFRIPSYQEMQTSRTASSEPAHLYQTAVEKLASMKNFSMSVSTGKQTGLDNQFLKETSHKDIFFWNYGTVSMTVDSTESASFGSHKVNIHEQYRDHHAYTEMGSSFFTSNLSPEDYLQHLIPVQLLSPELYQDITMQEVGSMTQITFLQPVQPESWALKVKADLLEAAGQVLLDSQGNLVKSRYTLRCSLDGAIIQLGIQVTYQAEPEAVFQPLIFSGRSAMIPDPSIPRLLESATGCLLQADGITAKTAETIVSQAGNLIRQQNTDLTLAHTFQNPDILLTTDVRLTDNNQGGTSTLYRQEETFRDGVYNFRVLEGNAQTPPFADVTEDAMVKYCRDLLVSTILLPEYIDRVQVTEQEHTYTITFSATEAMSQIMCANACETLYQDSDALNSAAASYRTNCISSTLVLSKATGIPTSSGFQYNGTHTIDGNSYDLTMEIRQDYQFRA